MTDTSPNEPRRRGRRWLLLLIPISLILAAASWIWWGDAPAPTAEEAALRARVGVPIKIAPSAECLEVLHALRSSGRTPSDHLRDMKLVRGAGDLSILDWSSVRTSQLRAVATEHAEAVGALADLPPEFLAGIATDTPGVYELQSLLLVHTELARRKSDVSAWTWGVERLLDLRRHCLRTSASVFELCRARARFQGSILRLFETTLASLESESVIVLSDRLAAHRLEPPRLDIVWGSYQLFCHDLEWASDPDYWEELGPYAPEGWDLSFALKKNRSLRRALRRCEEMITILEEERLTPVPKPSFDGERAQRRWVVNRVGDFLHGACWVGPTITPRVPGGRVCWRMLIAAVEIRRHEIEHGELPEDLNALIQRGPSLDPEIYRYESAERTISVPAVDALYEPGTRSARMTTTTIRF